MVKIFGFEFFKKKEEPQPQQKIVSVDDLNPYSYAGQTSNASWQNSIYDGEKFFGGMGAVQLFQLDYWTLRQRSAQLFTTNLYARGIIRRLVTNEITTGLCPESRPEEKIIGVPEDSLNDWTEEVENRFALWGNNPQLCDWKNKENFAAIQQEARIEALVSGDVLVVLRQSQVTKLPMVQLVSGNKVQTPLMSDYKLREGHSICHGVETDMQGRIVAYHVIQDDLSSKRLPAWGEKSGRRIAWLVYGTDKRLDDVRGQPILSLVLQSLQEIDRYRDAVQRKAVINSVLAMFIKKTQDKMGSLPVTNGALRKDQVSITDAGQNPRKFNITQHIPGMVMEELQQGEEPIGFHSQGIDINFGVFEQAIIQSVAWANEMPPEILTLSFSSNYSASQQAVNEFKMYLHKIWEKWGSSFCTPIYIEWLLSEVLNQKINAPSLLESWRDPQKHDVFGGWTTVEWYGSMKLSTKMIEQAKAAELFFEMGLSTRAKQARLLSGEKFSKTVHILEKENKQLMEALEPIFQAKQKYGEQAVNDALEKTAKNNFKLHAVGDDLDD